MDVCRYVCLLVCMCTCIDGWMFVCSCVFDYVSGLFFSVCMYIGDQEALRCRYVCLLTLICVYMDGLNVCMCVCMCVCMRKCVYMDACVYRWLDVCIFVCV